MRPEEQNNPTRWFSVALLQVVHPWLALLAGRIIHAQGRKAGSSATFTFPFRARTAITKPPHPA
ncbi:hypothetical protein EJ02DRAFT_452150 [Clathrospora elynae]|uniref:Uncharacterized protein n=1 Tax=Clathrospora elynae TaxID=706981 RepID=A0A6A5SVW0_9PLEO|nr:hypothetical protein EJ02DRAFT_452150 [Clathrospora elynae]